MYDLHGGCFDILAHFSIFSDSSWILSHEEEAFTGTREPNEGDDPLNDGVLMQYTGLNDKNGIEIYEGDVLGLQDSDDQSKFIVEYHESSFKKRYTSHEHPVGAITMFDLTDIGFVVIGNIYENPELLQSSKDNKILFYLSIGFGGESYYMNINGEFCNISFRKTRDEAKEIARRILREKGIEYADEIIFEWDGTL